MQNRHRDKTKSYSYDPAHQTQQHRFEKDHAQNANAPPADGQQNADLVRPFEHTHQNRVGHAHRAHNERDDRGSPAHRLRHLNGGVVLRHFARGESFVGRKALLDRRAQEIDLLRLRAGFQFQIEKINPPLALGRFL